MSNQHTSTPSGSADISHRTLACGMPIAFEPIEGARSVGITWLLPAGAATDPDDRCGISSVVSELMLRGAGSMDSKALADEFDRAGVVRSIESAIRHLAVSATTTGDRIDEALSLLVETVLHPRFDAESVEPSKALALQSIASLADDPQERAVLGARARHLPEPFNRSTHGTESGVSAITREDAAAWWNDRSKPSGSVLGLAGDVDEDAIVDRLNDLVGSWSGQAAAIVPAGAPPRGYLHEEDASNQVQIVVVQDGPAETNPDSELERLAVSVLSGGMSGRLFTQVREVRGLCYSVHAAYRSDQDRGVVTGYVGTTPERAQEALDVLFEELNKINTGDVTSDELARAKIGMRSRLVFSGESTGARASAIAGDISRIGRVRSLESRLNSIEQVSLDQLNEYLRRRDPGRATIQTVGPSALNPPAGV